MNAPSPRASVIVAAYQSDSVLAGCLEALRTQSFTDFEVIVVNSSPGDRMRERVMRRFPEVIYLESGTRLLPHEARNRGVLAARGELLVFTDADCRSAPDWLERLVEAQTAGREVVCGSIEPDGASWFEKGVHLCKYSFRLSGLEAGPCSIAGTANACYSRTVWDEVGPFQGQRFAGDALLSWKARQRGWIPWFEPRAIVRHKFNHTPVELWRERVERGEDFAAARTEFEGWSILRVLVYLAAFPLLPVLQVVRSGRDAFTCGWRWSFVATIVPQLFGHLAWSIGEARVHGALLLRKTLFRGSEHTRRVEKSASPV